MSFFSPKARRPLLLPLVPLYAAGAAVARRFSGERKWLAEPVISIGSISAGGAGKTPMTLLLSELLQGRGFAPQILTRGYKRRAQSIERVDPAGDAVRYGDEPLLLAQRSGVPVYVGRERYRAGQMAERGATARMVHLLDDGFQHRGLGRDVDLVLVTRRDVEEMLLPAGNLREPLSALRRADVIVLREEEAELASELERFFDAERRPAIWVVQRRLSFEKVLPKRPLVFCGIARPDGLLSMLRAEGCEPVATVAFADHHAYSLRDVEHLVTRARRAQSDGFITTEKDAVKLSPAMRVCLEPVGPIVVARLDVQLAEEEAAMDALLALIAERHRGQANG